MADLVDRDDLELARMEVEERVLGTFLQGAEIVTVDSESGRGLDGLLAALDRLAAAMPPREDRHRPRLWVDRSFAIAGAGTVVTGTLCSGGLSTGEEVEVLSASGARRARIRGLQAFGAAHASLPPGCRAAVNLTGLGHREIRRGDAIVHPGQWHRTRVVDASLRVLPSAPRPVRTGGALLVHLGCEEHAAHLRVLGGGSIQPGSDGLVRLSLPVALPLLPGDRFVVWDSGAATTIGGGEVLDVDPVLRISEARPDRSVDRVVAERGWVEADLLERLTGVRREPVIGPWVVDPAVLQQVQENLRTRVDAAGPMGLDLASLGARERAVLDFDERVSTSAGRATSAGREDLLPSDPFLAALASEPFSPPPPEHAGVDRGVVRELVRRGLAVEEAGIVFHVQAVDAAAVVAAQLLASKQDGFSVSELRGSLGTTRRFAMAILAILDRQGVTRRQGAVRLAGPRIPVLGA
jgi:selenocysteine-specific elongation factor